MMDKPSYEIEQRVEVLPQLMPRIYRGSGSGDDTDGRLDQSMLQFLVAAKVFSKTSLSAGAAAMTSSAALLWAART